MIFKSPVKTFSISTVSDVLSREFKYDVLPNKIFLPSLIPEIAQATDFAMQSLGLYNQKVHVLSEMNKTIACDVSKSQKVLGYTPKFSLYEGMVESIKYLKDLGVNF